MDVSKLRDAGWQAKIDLNEGIRSVYEGLGGKDWF